MCVQAKINKRSFEPFFKMFGSCFRTLTVVLFRIYLFITEKGSRRKIGVQVVVQSWNGEEMCFVLLLLFLFQSSLLSYLCVYVCVHACVRVCACVRALHSLLLKHFCRSDSSQQRVRGHLRVFPQPVPQHRLQRVQNEGHFPKGGNHLRKGRVTSLVSQHRFSGRRPSSL